MVPGEGPASRPAPRPFFSSSSSGPVPQGPARSSRALRGVAGDGRARRVRSSTGSSLPGSGALPPVVAALSRSARPGLLGGGSRARRARDADRAARPDAGALPVRGPPLPVPPAPAVPLGPPDAAVAVPREAPSGSGRGRAGPVRIASAARVSVRSVPSGHWRGARPSSAAAPSGGPVAAGPPDLRVPVDGGNVLRAAARRLTEEGRRKRSPSFSTRGPTPVRPSDAERIRF